MNHKSNILFITGIITAINDATQGETWQKQSFVIKSNSKFPSEICFYAWNQVLDQLSRCRLNDIVTVYFNPESKFYQEKYYTELKAWKIEINFVKNENI